MTAARQIGNNRAFGLPSRWWYLLVAVIGLTCRVVNLGQFVTVVLAAATISAVVIGLSPFPKKFNRYLVPTFPLIAIVAACGLAELQAAGIRRSQHWRPALAAHAGTIGAVNGTALALFAVGSVAASHPYTIAYFFDPLFGGTSRGVRAFQVGWGEGLEQAAAWLNAQPDITGTGVATTRRIALQPYLRPGANSYEPAVADTFPPNSGYAVVYLRDAQAQTLPPFAHLAQNGRLQHVVWVHGVPYVWIYQLAPPVTFPSSATFGGSLRLRGYDVVAAHPDADVLTIHLFWDVLVAPGQDYRLFAHLVDSRGTRITQTDPLLPSGTWLTGQYVTTEITLPWPTHHIVTNATLVFGVYEPETQQRLTLVGDPRFAPEQVGPDALYLIRFRARVAPRSCER